MISQRFFWILTAFIISVSTLPILLAEGMFMDGLQYSCIARNMSIGEGTIWFPKYIEYWYRNDIPFFLEQPPTAFWLEALLFKIIGDKPFVEELYSFFTLLISAGLIHLIWKQVFYQKEDVKSLSWLPISIWILIPTVHWSFGNNMLEINMTMFCLAATYFYLKSLAKYSQYWVVQYSLAIIGAFLSKGFPGLFPVLLPAFCFILLENTSVKKIITDYSITVSIFTLFVLLMILIDDANESFSLYLNNRVLNSIKNVSNVSSRLSIIWTLFNQLSYLLILFVLSLFFRAKVQMEFSSEKSKWVLTFILLGISGSIPLIITKEQRGFYLCPSMSFYALGFSIYFVPFFKNLHQKLNSTFIKHSRLIQSTLIIGMIVLPYNLSRFENRDSEEIRLVGLISEELSRKTTITIPHQMWSNWNLHAYLQRDLQINLSMYQKTHYYLTDLRIKSEVPAEFSNIVIATENYQLYTYDSTTSPTNR